MADLRNPDAVGASRWAWDEYGYTDVFPGKITFSDIDAIIEWREHFLLVENKHYETWIEPGFSFNKLKVEWEVPHGQLRMFQVLARDPSWTVLVLLGQAKEAVPEYVFDISTGIHHDFRALSNHQQRRDGLTQIFADWVSMVQMRTAA